MDTKIAAALNNLNLNSQQKKIINEVLDNKFKYIEPNVIKFDNIQIYEERLVLEEEHCPGIKLSGVTFASLST